MDNFSNDDHHRGQRWAACLLLAALVLAAYGPALNCGFVPLDDPAYVTQNPYIQNGLTWQSVAWAFRAGYASNWHPLTWLSHALDIQLFGLNPAGHHATSVAFHLANSILLFLVLTRMTAAPWRSAMVAGLFAVHPLHVESVAWVAERKDVLSTFFWILSVWAYARYAEHSQRPWLLASLALFALGLMSKPMVVTLPFVLLLLDCWPLRRAGDLSSRTICRLAVEKMPFFVLAAISCLVTYLVQKNGGSVSSLNHISLGARLDNLPVAYERYLEKTFWPATLEAFYAHPRFWPWWRVVLAGSLLAAITAWAVLRWKKQPYLAVGWFWFLGMLVPVIGLVQVGNQSMADRYSYLPIVGIFIMAVWGAGELLTARTAAILGSLIILVCAGLTWRQTHAWRNYMTLFVPIAEDTAASYDVFFNLALYWQNHGDPAKAATYYEKCLASKPDYALAHNNLGYLLLQNGKAGDAMTHFEAALRSQPVYPEASYNLGRACLSNGLPQRAVDCFRDALKTQPDVAAINLSMGDALEKLGKFDSAIAYFEKARQLAAARHNTAFVNTIEQRLRQCRAAARK